MQEAFHLFDCGAVNTRMRKVLRRRLIRRAEREGVSFYVLTRRILEAEALLEPPLPDESAGGRLVA